MLTEGRTHGWRRVGFAGLKGQLDYGNDFLGHRLGLRGGSADHPHRRGCGL